MIFIGIDDTDMPSTRGTGHLARVIADNLAEKFHVAGVVRHQLLFDSRVPYTAKNSSASIILDNVNDNLSTIFEQVRAVMRENFIEGSDPGLAVAQGDIPDAIVKFSQMAKKELSHRDTAKRLAQQHGILLEGLGGTDDGMIGALASIGLSSSGNDGRYIRVGTIRDITLPCNIETIHQAGIVEVRTLDNQPVLSGTVKGKNLRPARRNHQPILFVESATDGTWESLKID